MTGLENPATLAILEMEKELSREQGDAPPEEKEIDTADFSAMPILEVNHLTTRFVSKKTFLGKPTHLVHAVEYVGFKLFPGETLLVGK